VNEISGFHAKNNLVLSASVGPYKTIGVDFVLRSVRFKELLQQKKNLSVCVGVVSFCLTAGIGDIV
jgi:hypothetical protein